ncbi:MAG: TRAP transporter large permease subunit [Alphaproteobacteria bacterium]|nr:TRAP transporter large permease subunit [Alphaproteobacteria bacterium]
MSIELITVAMFGGMIVLLLLGLPLAFVTGIIAVTFGLGLFGLPSLLLISSRVYSFMNEYVLVSVPMFILMASIMERSGVARDLFRAMHVWAGGLKGGLAVQTTLAATVMAAMTGIIGGEIVLLGLVALPQMLRLGYDRKLAIGTICAGGSLGSMIPPSIVLVIYGLTVNVSIGDLFAAAVVPGLIMSGMYIAYILIRCHLDPSLGPPAPEEERNIPFAEKLRALKSIALPMLIAFSVLGTIYTGIASVTEAAGMGVVGTAVAAAIRREFTWPMLQGALTQTMAACGILLWVSFGATAMIGVYNLAGGPAFVRNLMVGLPVAPIVVVLIMMAILLVLGCLMDWIGICLLTMPVFVPIVKALGYDPIWFGVLFCMNMQISYLSPPFGPAAFYLKGVAPPDISLNEIFASLWPFMGLQAVALFLIIMFPGIALWLPGLN